MVKRYRRMSKTPDKWNRDALLVARKFFKGRRLRKGELVAVDMETGLCLRGDDIVRCCPPMKKGDDRRLIRIGARTAFKIHSPIFQFT